MVLIVRITLILFISCAAPAVFLLWRNAAAPDAAKNAGIVIAAMLPVLIAVFPYFNTQILENRYAYLLLYDKTTGELTTGKPGNPYHLSYIRMFANIGGGTADVHQQLRDSDPQAFTKDKGLNLIERGIMAALVDRFFFNWDQEEKTIKLPGQVIDVLQSDANSLKTVLSMADITSQFPNNVLIESPGMLTGIQFVLPPNTRVIRTRSQDGYGLKIQLSNSILPVDINVNFTGMVAQQQGIWGVQNPDPDDINRYYGVGFNVIVTGRPNRTMIYAPEMTQYRRWFDNISATLAIYDWEKIDKAIEESLRRQSISKNLGIPPQ